MHLQRLLHARSWPFALFAWLSLSVALRAAEEQAGERPRPRPASLIEPLFTPPPIEMPIAETDRPAGDATSGTTGPPGTADRASGLWLVSTRRLPRAGEDGVSPAFAPDVSRYVAGRGWVPSALDELVGAGNPAAATGIFVHGNDTSATEAADDGEELYRQLVSAGAEVRPARFVIWSWPIVKTNVRVRKSAQANALRANLEGYFLAEFLCRLAPQVPVSVVGYSSGAGVVTGALHVVGGGTLEGRTLRPMAPPQPRAIPVVLLGAAMPNDWLLPGMPHERALSQTERMVVTVNATDAVLRWYSMLWGRGGPSALGATGVPDTLRSGAERAKIVPFDLQTTMHQHHGWRYYVESPEVISLLRREMLASPATQVRRGPAGAGRLR